MEESNKNPGGLPITTLSNANTDGASVFLVKYDKDGAAQWAISLNSPEESYASSVSLDGSGNVYVSGSFQTAVTIGATNFTNSGQENGFIAKFDSSGVLQWARQMEGVSDDSALAVSPDSSGNVYAAGGFGSAPGDTVTFAPSIILTNIGVGIPGSGIGDAFLAKYDASSGAVEWARRFGGTE